MEKIYKDLFYEDLNKYKALCDVVLTIFAIAESNMQKTNYSITEHVLLDNLIKKLEILDYSGYSNSNGYQISKLFYGSLDDRLKLISSLAAEIKRSNKDTIDSNFLHPRVDEITVWFNKKLDLVHSNISERTELNIIYLLKKHHDLLLKFLFSDADEYQRTKLLSSLINDTNNYHTFSNVTGEFIKDGIILNHDFKTYNLYRKKYAELISRMNFYGNSKQIILNKIKDSSFVLDFIRSGARIRYSVIMEYFKKDTLNDLNIDLLNILIENHRNNGNLNVMYDYKYDSFFYSAVNDIFIDYISKISVKKTVNVLDINFSPFTTEHESSYDNGSFVMYPEWNEKVYKAIIDWIKESLDQMPDYMLEYFDVDQFISDISSKIIAKSHNQAQTDECVGKMNELYDEIWNYFADRKDIIKLRKLRSTSLKNDVFSK